jgi:hypothetical protein
MLITLVPSDEHIRNQSKIAKLIDFNEVFELVKSNFTGYAKQFGSISYLGIKYNSLK